jgi:poly-beta-1,6-N-acetyl-D-glucosamine synthase
MSWLYLIPVIPYFLTILVIAINRRRLKLFNSLADHNIAVSVIIPCRNEGKNLPHIIDDLLNQSYPVSLYNIMVVDDGSEDNTPEVLGRYSGKPNLKIIRSSGKGKKRAIREGIGLSDAELIVTIDADCRAGKNWLKSIVTFYAETGATMIIGPVIIEADKGFFGKFQELEFFSLQGITAGTAAMNNPVMCNGANLAFKKEVYLRHSVNLRDEIDSGDDIFLLQSLKKEDRRAISFLESGEAVVKTHPSGTLPSFIRQRSRWLSKAGYYSDPFILYLGIVTFVTIFYMILLLGAGFFNAEFLILFATVVIIKSLPDFLLLSLSTGRYNRQSLLAWFLPSQIIYPFYVIAVALGALFRKGKW